MLKVFCKWINHHSNQLVETFAFFFTLKRKYFSLKKTPQFKFLFYFPLFSNRKMQNTKRREGKQKEISSRAKKACFFYKIVLIFNSINTKLLFRHRPSAGDATGDSCRRWPGGGTGCSKVSFPQLLTQPKHRLKAFRGF